MARRVARGLLPVLLVARGGGRKLVRIQRNEGMKRRGAKPKGFGIGKKRKVRGEEKEGEREPGEDVF